jgi:hypothetical protein
LGIIKIFYPHYHGLLPLPYVYAEIKKGLLTHVAPDAKLCAHKIYICSYKEDVMTEMQKEMLNYIQATTR